MGKEKDVTEKLLAGYNDVFADIVNVLLFDGEPIIREEELEDSETASQYKSQKKYFGQDRDVAKLWKKNDICLSFLGLEHQTDIDRSIPLRVIGYDGAAYRSQIGGVRNAHREKQYHPVVTLVLYFGKTHWKEKYRSLHGCLAVPEELKPYVNDYKVNVIEVAYLDEETINKFQSDFRLVADYFVQRRKNGNYNPPEQEIKHVEATLACLTAISGDDSLIDTYSQSERRITNMCEMIEKIREEGRAEGRAEGRSMMEKIREEGRAEGRAQERSMINKIVEEGRTEGHMEGRFSAFLTTVSNLMGTMNLTADQAMEVLKIPEEERESIKLKISANSPQ